MAAITRAVETAFNLHRGELHYRTLERRISWPRRLAMLLMRERLGKTNGEIAQHFSLGNATVSTGISKIRKQTETDPAYQRRYAVINRALNALAEEKAPS